jgi:hypothetical protein
MPRRIFSLIFPYKILALSVYYKAKDSMVCGKYYSDKFILSKNPIPKDAHQSSQTQYTTALQGAPGGGKTGDLNLRLRQIPEDLES